MLCAPIAISIRESQKLSSQGIFKNKFVLHYNLTYFESVCRYCSFPPISFILHPVSFHNSIRLSVSLLRLLPLHTSGHTILNFRLVKYFLVDLSQK